MKDEVIEGRVSFEPDVREKFASFKLSKSSKDRDGNPVYGQVRCIAFKDAIAAVSVISKGDIVRIKGELRPAADWTAKDGTTKDGGWEFVVDQIRPVERTPKVDEEGRERRQKPAAAPTPAPAKPKMKMLEDDTDVPF